LGCAIIFASITYKSWIDLEMTQGCRICKKSADSISMAAILWQFMFFKQDIAYYPGEVDLSSKS
jgi:hypothetical protein